MEVYIGKEITNAKLNDKISSSCQTNLSPRYYRQTDNTLPCCSGHDKRVVVGTLCVFIFTRTKALVSTMLSKTKKIFN